jgi:hypothetical protein
MEMDTQILLVARMGEEGLLGILNVKKEMLQAALTRTKALVIARNRNKASKFARVNSYRYELSFITLSKRNSTVVETEETIFTFRNNDVILHLFY